MFQAVLLEPRLLRTGKGELIQVSQGRPPPQSQRLIEQPHGCGRLTSGQRSTTRGGEPLETQHVQLLGRDSQPITRDGRSRATLPVETQSRLAHLDKAAARSGARSGQSSAARRSADTTALALVSSSASTPRVRAPPIASDRPPDITSRGPRTPNSKVFPPCRPGASTPRADPSVGKPTVIDSWVHGNDRA